MTAEHASQATLPEPDLRPAWRAACLAYRGARAEGSGDLSAFDAARAAVLDASPDLGEAAAGEQAHKAIAFASVHHAEWFWGPVRAGGNQ